MSKKDEFNSEEMPVNITETSSIIKSKITLNEYLSNFSTNHSIDAVIYGWVLKKKASKCDKKTKSEWDSIVQEFLNEK